VSTIAFFLGCLVTAIVIVANRRSTANRRGGRLGRLLRVNGGVQ